MPAETLTDLTANLPIATEPKDHSWLTRLVGAYLRRDRARHPSKSEVDANASNASDGARSAIRKACIKSAVTGAAAGAVSTAATVLTAETEGIAGFVAVPVAALAMGGDMAYRALVHVDLTCDLARLFGIALDPEDPDDLWRIYALTFGAHTNHQASDDPGRELVHEVTHLEGEKVAETIGNKIIGETLMRNIVPFVGIATSAVTNYLVTRRLGDNVRRYMRYQRAMNDAFSLAATTCERELELMIEGMWFIFSADGRLAPEETACLATFLRRLDPVTRHAVTARFVEDELDWTERIKKEVPEPVRDAFFHALEVAAAVDKELSLPERKILRRAAFALGRTFDEKRVERMMAEFEEHGVLSDDGYAPISEDPD